MLDTLVWLYCTISEKRKAKALSDTYADVREYIYFAGYTNALIPQS